MYSVTLKPLFSSAMSDANETTTTSDVRSLCERAHTIISKMNSLRKS